MSDPAKPVHSLSESLLRWYGEHKRPLPWRKNKDPYKVWLSEIILQQTRIDQGRPYFERFAAKYPDVHSLANADEVEVLNLWQGLGYYSRARNLHHTAKFVSGKLGGNFPHTQKDLRKLKGIGEYTSAAIASICFSEAVPVVDGNVMRVISRIYLIPDALNDTAQKAKIYKHAVNLLDRSNPGDFNQAIMELGSLICKPFKPECEICPVSSFCGAYKHQKTTEYPKPKIKLVKKERSLFFLIPVFNNGCSLLTRRNTSDIWKGLYTFPLLDKEKHKERLQRKLAEKACPIETISIKHILSHQIILADFLRFQIKDRGEFCDLWNYATGEMVNIVKEDAISSTKDLLSMEEKSNIFEIEFDELFLKYPLPRLISKYLEKRPLEKI
ncbi:MAG: A/G-specific adenine glycosylase [Flavobacteriales bacterium]|nr:A/G-specific adenine glycosylase [Flavobacteriales bacterium]